MIHSIKPKQELSSVRNSLPMMAVLKKNPLIKGVTPQVSARIFYQSGSVLLNGNAIGIDVLEEDRLFNFKQYIGVVLGTHQTPNHLALCFWDGA